MKPDYIEYRVYIKDSSNVDLLLKVANAVQDVINECVGDSVVSYGNDFTDIADVLQSGDTSFEVHMADD